MHKLWHNDKSWHSSCHRKQQQQQLLAVPLGESGPLQNIIFLLISYLRNITFDQKVQAQEQLGWREKERAVKILKFPALRPRRWWGLGVHLFLDPTRALYAMASHCRPAPAFYGTNNPTLIIDIFLLFIPEHDMIFLPRVGAFGETENWSQKRKSQFFLTLLHF